MTKIYFQVHIHYLLRSSGNKAESVRVGQAVSWSINKDPDPPSVVHGIVTSVNSARQRSDNASVG